MQVGKLGSLFIGYLGMILLRARNLRLESEIVTLLLKQGCTGILDIHFPDTGSLPLTQRKSYGLKIRAVPELRQDVATILS